MINGYVNAPKELFDIPFSDILNGTKLELGDELFNKFFEFVMAASHKVPMFAGTFYSEQDEEISISGAGSYFSMNSLEGGLVAYRDITTGTLFVIEATPNAINISAEN